MELPVGNIVTGIATVVSVVMANRLSSSQTGRAKLWDLRRQTYGVIASELSSVERICDAADAHIEENIHWYFDSDIKSSHDALIREHMNTLRQRFSDDYLIASDKFTAIFERFLHDLDMMSPEEVFPTDHVLFVAAVRTHRPLILAQGRKEISPRRKVWETFIRPILVALRHLVTSSRRVF